MSASTDALSAAVSSLSDAVASATASIKDLKDKLAAVPAPAGDAIGVVDTAAVDKAVADIQAATDALKAAVAV